MSVVRQLVVTAAVEAFRGRTIAENEVFDSKIDTFKGLLNEGAHTAIIVSVEESEQVPAGQDEQGFFGRTTILRMLVQAVVVSVGKIKDSNGEKMVPGIAETDTAYESMLNILDRQWRAVLHQNNDVWAGVFRGLVVKVGQIIDTRAIDPEVGRKYACRYTQVDLQVVDEPVPGDPLPDCIEAGLSAMEATGDAGFGKLAEQFRTLLTGIGTLPEWQELQSQLFMTRGGVAALGLGPVEIDDLVDFDAGRIRINDTDYEVIDDQ